MNKTFYMINQRLSLRKPQTEALAVLEKLADILELKKDADLNKELDKVKNEFKTVTSFERDFPSLCFALATGVGKTRLMGAFLVYLHIEKGINNFFVVSPNLTVYRKLIDDFSNTSSDKYVFKGISEFVHKPPRIITGDNYNSQIGGQQNYLSKVTINMFNISKINTDSKKSRKKGEDDKPARIKRLSEYLGESYFNYLASLDDLVLLMDESHHYRADKGLQSLNELKPVLGLEVTATPQIEKNGKTIKFKNVVYEYSLAKAIRDGYVKEPAVATRKDFNPDKYSPEDLDKLKIEDGIRIHEETKMNLYMYAKNNNVRYVKPFVLIVAKDTDHAENIMKMIQSDSFFGGKYKDKVMVIHSNQSGAEKDENIEKLLTVENHDNKIEIVIHVNMLKEGWDVNNLYTIIPLRAAASTTLREQTIGRGLRLPYGIKTGDEKVDKLTIVQHDKFEEIIELAQREDSIIRKENVIEIDENELAKEKDVVTSHSNVESQIIQKEETIDQIKNPLEKHKAQIGIKAEREIVEAINNSSSAVKSIKDLKNKEIKNIVINKIKDKINSEPQISMFSADIIKEAEERYDAVIGECVKNIIEIPRITIQPTDNIKSGFNDFDLDTNSLNYQPSSETILIKTLREGKIELIDSNKGRVKYDSMEDIIVSELIEFPEIDYDNCSKLLFKLVRQAIKKLKSYLNEHDAENVIVTKKKEIAKFIYIQMMQEGHFYYDVPDYEKPIVRPFTKIEEQSFSKYKSDDIYDFRETIEPVSDIPKKVFSGFKKSCHNLYKFDSKTEKDLSIILEDDKVNPQIVKWLRPAKNQFKIYWDYNSKEYCPDFVVETNDCIYMVETKKKKEIGTREVEGKAKAALEYCRYAAEYTSKNGGKPWKYVLIPHDIVKQNMSFEFLVKNYEVKSI